MAIQDFLDTYQQSMANKKIVNPLSSRNTAIKNSKLGITSGYRGVNLMHLIRICRLSLIKLPS